MVVLQCHFLDAALIGSRDIDPATAPTEPSRTSATISNTVQTFVASLPDDAALREWLRGGMMPHLLPHPALLPVWLLLSPVWAGYRLYRFAVHGDVGEDLSLSSASVPDERLESGVVPVAAPVAAPVASPIVAAEIDAVDTPRIVPLLPVSEPIASSSLPDKAAANGDNLQELEL
jgi:hypothetical protein